MSFWLTGAGAFSIAAILVILRAKRRIYWFLQSTAYALAAAFAITRCFGWGRSMGLVVLYPGIALLFSYVCLSSVLRLGDRSGLARRKSEDE
jgi:hypothetical protein